MSPFSPCAKTARGAQSSGGGHFERSAELSTAPAAKAGRLQNARFATLRHETQTAADIPLAYFCFPISSQAPPFASRRRLWPPRPASNVPSRHAMMLKLPCVRGSGGSSTWASCEAAAQSLERNEQ